MHLLGAHCVRPSDFYAGDALCVALRFSLLKGDDQRTTQ
jgi:hypothetical protein